MNGANKFRISDIDLSGLSATLKRCGGIVVTEITRGVSQRLKPDGSPQKQNAPSTIKKKGHDHPVVEKRFRFVQRETYSVEPTDQETVRIGIASAEDEAVAASLEEKGYDFFGITAAAAKETDEIIDTYLTRVIRDCMGGK